MLEREKDAAVSHRNLSEVPKLSFSSPDGTCSDMPVRDRIRDRISLLFSVLFFRSHYFKKRSSGVRWDLLAGAEQLRMPVKGSLIAEVWGEQESK